MNEHFESDAHDYLLNHMEPARRRAFDEELQRDAAAQAALKTCADALAGFACEVAAPETLSAADQQATLAAILEATQPDGARHGVTRPVRWQRFLWPAAAAVLLVLNLFDFERPLMPGMGGHVASDRTREKKIAPGENPGKSAAGSAKNSGSDTNPEAMSPAARTPAVESAVAKSAAEIVRLRASVAELQQAQDRVRGEYDGLVRRIAAQATADRDLNRLATMELVDAGSFARGERKGLVNVGRGILTEPGIVIVPEPPPSPPNAASSLSKQPYAWSVFDEKERRGYLNLYQLPTLSADQSMQVWVRPGDETSFQRVGEVPTQYSGGNGGVQYTLPGTTVPAEVLITIEPRNAVPVAPTGPTVLRGP
jgi:anti-sigma-K factor RskA